MKRLTLSEWEEKYVVDKMEPFDQKNTMFNRPAWDPEIHHAVESWAITGTVKDKPGYRLEDWALNWASRRGTLFNLFNASKPASGKGAKALTEAISGAHSSTSPLLTRPPVGKNICDSNPESLTKKVKKAALWFGADMVGICRLDRRWAYSRVYDRMPYMGGRNDTLESPESIAQKIPENFQWAVVMCFEQSYELVSYYPTFFCNAATSMGYSRMAIANHYLSAFIRFMGFEAMDCTSNDVALSIPMAMQAGLGDLGRNGLLITPRFGPRVRISKVITDLPLVPDGPIDFGVTGFCESCEMCAEKCPSQSIRYGSRTAEVNNISNIGGVMKWPVDAETCRMYWGKKNQGCSLCMSYCPYNKPDTRFHRMVGWFIDHVRWGTPFYVFMDKVLGYGKPRDPKRFWEKWRPDRN